MLNFRFIRYQYKKVLIPAGILFIILSLTTIIFVLTSNSFSSAKVIVRGEIVVGGVINFNESARLFYYYGFEYLFLFTFSIMLPLMLLTNEVNEGYIVSWLTLPMSRKTILNSKFFLIIMTIVTIRCGHLFLQLGLFALVFKDFGSQAQIRLVVNNLPILFVWILWTAIVWLIACVVNKPAIYGTIILVLLIFFLFCHIHDAITYGKILFQDETPHALADETGLLVSIRKSLKYLSITSLGDWIIKLDFAKNDEKPNALAKYDEFSAIDGKNFVWQIPTMIIASGGLCTVGNYIFIKKDLSL